MQDPAAETTERVGIFRFYPKLDREERIELLERVQLGATANVDYVIMMILSATLASLSE